MTDGSSLEVLAVQTLATVAQDSTAPAAARAAAARALLELSGRLGPGRQPLPDTASKAGHEMTLAELNAALSGP